MKISRIVLAALFALAASANTLRATPSLPTFSFHGREGEAWRLDQLTEREPKIVDHTLLLVGYIKPAKQIQN